MQFIFKKIMKNRGIAVIKPIIRRIIEAANQIIVLECSRKKRAPVITELDSQFMKIG